MTSYRRQEQLRGRSPIVSNNSNFIKPAKDGDSVLISWTDAVTMFHEFGHALHGLCSQVTFPSLSGTSVARDFVEFPSQLNEQWLETDEILTKFALHHQTGQAMPRALLEKIKKASKFNQGFQTVEFLSCAILDMKLHMLRDDLPSDFDLLKYEEDALRDIGMPKEIVMRHRLPHFAHIFSTDSYSAGYYSYLWADTLVADAAEAFAAAPGKFYDSAVARSYFDHVLSKGNSVDPDVAYRNFRGRGPNLDALLRKRGFL